MVRRLGGVVLLGWAVGVPAFAGNVNLELRPVTQTVHVGDAVALALYAVSADGLDQAVGFVGVVLTFDADALALVGHDDGGAFAWGSSGFPSEGAGVNSTFADGTAYYQAVVVQGGPLATATAAGLLVTTLQFEARTAGTGTHQVTIVPCISTTCSRVLDRHPFSAGAINVTGALGAPVSVTIHCVSDFDCNDANPCTDDACDADDFCTLTPNDANSPDDGLFCNGLEICLNGEAVTDPNSVPDCNDGLACTADSCNEAGNVCNNALQAGFCLIGNQCVANGAVNPSNDCEWCATATTTDAWSPRTAGALCGDPAQTECNQADTCDGTGACQANFRPPGYPCGNSVATVCTAPDSCDGDGICEANDAPNGTTCDDLLWCTVTDVCASGACVGGGTPCPGQTCDEATASCKAVDVELQAPSAGPFAVGDTADIDLYLYSDVGGAIGVGSLAAILSWNPAQLELLGRVDTGPYDWFLSSFPNDAALDGLNDTFADGDAWYQASSQPAPNPPAEATVGGLLVTTFQFRVLAAGMAQVSLDDQRGQYSQTFVADAESPGLDITGTLGAPAGLTLVDCLDDGDCDDGAFCNGVESCSSMACVAGTPPDCDDGVFCNGMEVCEAGAGCVSPGNPCPDPVSCDETDNSCGGCDAPLVASAGSRYIRVDPLPHPTAVALLVTGDPGDGNVACFSAYVQSDGHLGVDPVYQDPAAWGVVPVSGGPIVPARTYRVSTDCRIGGTGFLSAASPVRTWRRGDVDGNGVSEIDDVFIVIDAANGQYPPGVTIENVDVSPCEPDGVADQADVNEVQAAYGGGSGACSTPCSACVAASAPVQPPQPTSRNRYLAFLGGNPGRQTAIRVRLIDLPPPYHVLNGATLWVGPPQATCENAAQSLPPAAGCGPTGQLPPSIYAAALQCQPFFTDWTSWGEVYAYHVAVVPDGTYQLQSIDQQCSTPAEDDFSEALTLVTAKWGDIVRDCATIPCPPPDGSVDVSTDVVACLDKFKNAVSAAKKSRCDLEPHTPDRIVNISDVTRILDAFTGDEYPFPPPSITCSP